MINHRLGRNKAAAGLIGKVVELRPDMMVVYTDIAPALTALGTLNGQGRKTSGANGWTYVGEFRDGKYHGQGTFTRRVLDNGT